MVWKIISPCLIIVILNFYVVSSQIFEFDSVEADRASSAGYLPPREKRGVLRRRYLHAPDSERVESRPRRFFRSSRRPGGGRRSRSTESKPPRIDFSEEAENSQTSSRRGFRFIPPSHVKNKDTDDERFSRRKNRWQNGGPDRQSRREEKKWRPNGGQNRWQNRGQNRGQNKRPNGGLNKPKGGPNGRSRQRPYQGRRKPASEEIIPSQKKAMEYDIESEDHTDDEYSVKTPERVRDHQTFDESPAFNRPKFTPQMHARRPSFPPRRSATRPFNAKPAPRPLGTALGGSRPATMPISIRRPIFLGHPPRSPWEKGATLQLCTPFSGGFQRKDSMGISYLVSQLGNPKNRLMVSRKFQNFIDDLKMEIDGNGLSELLDPLVPPKDPPVSPSPIEDPDETEGEEELRNADGVQEEAYPDEGELTKESNSESPLGEGKEKETTMNPGLKENDIDNNGEDDLDTSDADNAEGSSENVPELDITSEIPVKEGDGKGLRNHANEMDPNEYDDENDENGMNRPPVDDEHENDVNYHVDPVENPPQYNEEESVQNEEESTDEEYEENDDDQLMHMENDEENGNEDGENEENMEDVEDYADEHEGNFVDEANEENAEEILTEREEPQNTVPLDHNDYDEDATEEDEDIAEDIEDVDENLADRGAKGRRTLLADIPEAEFSEETVNGDYTLSNYPDYSASAHAAAASSYDYEDNYDYLR